MSSETFGQMLRRLREATVVPQRRSNRVACWVVKESLSQNELAACAGVNVSVISRIEAGKRHGLRRQSVEQLAEALDLSPIDRDRLLIAAGYWPWPNQADDIEDVLAIVHNEPYSRHQVMRGTF